MTPDTLIRYRQAYHRQRVGVREGLQDPADLVVIELARIKYHAPDLVAETVAPDDRFDCMGMGLAYEQL